MNIWAIIIMILCLLPGCKTQQAAQEPNQQAVQEPNRQAVQEDIPLRPITQEIISLAKDSGVNIKDFQYYISTTIELKQERRARAVEVDSDGNVIVRSISMPSEIKINKETKGMYIIAIPTPDNPAVFEICFDNQDRKNTLFFKANETGTCFELLYTEKPYTIKYGGTEYELSFPSASELSSPVPPQLLIKFNERALDRPSVQVAPGRSVNSK